MIVRQGQSKEDSEGDKQHTTGTDWLSYVSSRSSALSPDAPNLSPVIHQVKCITSSFYLLFGWFSRQFVQWWILRPALLPPQLCVVFIPGQKIRYTYSYTRPRYCQTVAVTDDSITIELFLQNLWRKLNVQAASRSCHSPLTLTLTLTLTLSLNFPQGLRKLGTSVSRDVTLNAMVRCPIPESLADLDISTPLLLSLQWQGSKGG